MIESSSSTCGLEEIKVSIIHFLKQKHKIPIPHVIGKASAIRVVVVLQYLIPFTQQIQSEPYQKNIMAELLLDIIQKASSSVQQVLTIHQSLSQLQCTQLRISHPSFYLIKLISLPTHLINLLSDHRISPPNVSLKDIHLLASQLYSSILHRIQQHLNLQDKVLIVNKLLILKQEELVLQHFIEIQPLFIIDNFNSLSKQSNILKYLYKKYVLQQKPSHSQTPNQAQRLALEGSNKLEHIITTIAQQYDITQSIMALLNFNQIVYYANNRYQLFYHLFKHQQHTIIRQLLNWWAASKQYIITHTHSLLRTNILALFLTHLTSQQLLQQGCLMPLTQGIKKRLTDGSSKECGCLIWKILGDIMQLQLTQQIKRSTYFQIKEEQTTISLSHQPSPNLQNKAIVQSIKDTIRLQQSESWQQQRQERKNGDDSMNKRQDLKQREDDSDQMVVEPKNIYDCLLALRNKYRTSVALATLPKLISSHPEDLVLMWNSLLQQLLTDLQPAYIPILTLLMTKRPESFIDSLILYCINKSNNIHDRCILIEILILGIEELSLLKQQKNKDDSKADFYFKKVRSRYYNDIKKVQIQTNDQANLKKEIKESRTKRWGHTRIAHQSKRSGPVNLHFLKEMNAVNRFYPIANLLYFKIIDPLSSNLIEALRQHQIYIQNILKLLAVFLSNIQNHFDKYLIISDISNHCKAIVLEMVDSKKKENNRYEQSGGQTLMLCLQVVNKMSLILDVHVPQKIMGDLKILIEGCRELPNFGLSSILQMIEYNIYKRVYQNSVKSEML